MSSEDVGVVLLGIEGRVLEACAVAESILGARIAGVRGQRIDEVIQDGRSDPAAPRPDPPEGVAPPEREAGERMYVELRRLGDVRAEAREAILLVTSARGGRDTAAGGILGRMTVAAPAMLFVLEPPHRLVLWLDEATALDLGLSFDHPRRFADEFFRTTLHPADVGVVLSQLEGRELPDAPLPLPAAFRVRRADGGWSPMTNRPALVWRRDSGRIRWIFGVVEEREPARSSTSEDRSGRVLGAVSEAADALLAFGDLGERIGRALEAVARAVEAEAATVWQFRRDDILRARVARALWEWRAASATILSSVAIRQELLLDGPLARWLESLAEGRERSGIASWMPWAERSHFEGRGIPSVLAIPISVQGSTWGFLELAGGNFTRARGPAERDAARILARHLGHALERDVAERRVRTLSRAVEQSPTAVLITDAQGAIEYSNPAFLETNGLSPEDLSEEDPAILASRGVAPVLMGHLLEAVRTPAPWRGELSEISRSGAAQWLRASVTPVRDECGRVTHLVVVEEDVTTARESARELLVSKEKLRALTARLVAVREEERRMLARELHDGIGQVLTGLSIGLQVLGRSPGAADPDLSGRLRDLGREVADALADVRDLARRIRPAALDVGLVPALQGELKAFGKRSGLSWELNAPNDLDLDPDRSLASFRFVQEALTNVVRHASGARSVRVRLVVEDRRLYVTVEDDGVGIDARSFETREGFGLVGLRERMAPWGGILRLEPVVPSGARAVVEIPLEEAGMTSPVEGAE